MASKKKNRSPFLRVLPVALKVVALCVIALVGLLLLLPAPPDRTGGGVTTIAKRIPKLRDTVDPLRDRSATPKTFRAPAPVVPPPTVSDESSSPRVVKAPAPVEEVVPQAPDTAKIEPPPTPFRKPETERLGAKPVSDSVAPQPQTGETSIARLPVEPPSPEPPAGLRTGLPDRSDIRDWLRSQAWEFLGGVDPQGNILYRFEVWLDAPRDVLKSIKSVTYVYDAPSATPGRRSSENSKNGFRARFGSLSCSKNVTVVVTMTDGRTREAVADGCRALN